MAVMVVHAVEERGHQRFLAYLKDDGKATHPPSRLRRYGEAGSCLRAFGDSLDLLFAGAYRDCTARGALTAHTAATGEVRWRRPELRKIQMLTLSADGERLYCGREGYLVRGGVFRDRNDPGAAQGSAVGGVLESPFEPLALVDRLSLIRDASTLTQPDAWALIPDP